MFQSQCAVVDVIQNCYFVLGKIYVFGGQDVDESTLSDLWSYDLNERQWNRVMSFNIFMDCCI